MRKDLKGVIKRLVRLGGLCTLFGVNAAWAAPVHKSPGNEGLIGRDLLVRAPMLLDQIDPAQQARFGGAERVDGAELQRLLPGMRAIVEPGQSLYRGIEEEQFGRRPAQHALDLRNRGTFYALSIFYDLGMGIGSYRIRENAVCSIVVPETVERCRSLFRLTDGTFALSSYEDPSRPLVRIRLAPRSSGR